MNNELFSMDSSGGICEEKYEGREAAILLVEKYILSH